MWAWDSREAFRAQKFICRLYNRLTYHLPWMSEESSKKSIHPRFAIQWNCKRCRLSLLIGEMTHQRVVILLRHEFWDQINQVILSIMQLRCKERLKVNNCCLMNIRRQRDSVAIWIHNIVNSQGLLFTFHYWMKVFSIDTPLLNPVKELEWRVN